MAAQSRDHDPGSRQSQKVPEAATELHLGAEGPIHTSHSKEQPGMLLHQTLLQGGRDPGMREQGS